METGLFNRLQAPLLAVATAGLFLLAVLNFRQERQSQQPDRGVGGREGAGGGGLVEERVLPNSPGQRAGIQAHDLLTGAEVLPEIPSQTPQQDTGLQPAAKPEHGLLTGVKPLPEASVREAGIRAEGLLPKANYVQIKHLADLERVLYRAGIYGNAGYAITRGDVPLETQVIPEPLDRGLALGLRVIGLIYLGIGLYVLFRRWTAPRATHFYLFCLVSFALYALKYTGALDPSGQWDWLDKVVFWANILAESLQPALFLHFALSFPEERLGNIRRRLLLPLVYAPGAALLGLWLWALTHWQATGLLKHRLEQTGTAYDAVFYLLAALLFLRSYSRADTPIERQQLKWLTRGTLLAVLPFTLFSAIPFLLDLNMPSLLTKVAGLSLVFLPLTFSWAIVRYRLMDTDLIFKRGVAYTVATSRLLGAYFGIIALIAELVHVRLPEAVREWAFVIAILVTAAVIEPLKRRIQNWVDKVFDRHRYDYRKALVEFGRGLSSETDLHALLASIVERLPRTLLVARVAVFMADNSEDTGRLRLAASHGLLAEALAAQESMDLGFLDFDQASDHSHIFLENAQQAMHLPAGQQRTAALLDLNYYLPCRVAASKMQASEAGPNELDTTRTIAVIGLGRTIGGDFLSSEDVELLESLASYIGIALQNASLYARLETKSSEFERLKEFNEYIVESIHVGILAIDLNDRIESWNAQMEAM